MDREQIDIFEDAGRKLKQAIRGLDASDLDAVPVAGKWSIRQVVVHLADTDLVLAERMKRVIAEEKPRLLAFDENLWVKNLHYELQSADDAADLLEMNRRLMANVFRLLPKEAFARVGIHSEAGEMSLAQLAEKSISHFEHHLKFLYAKREKLGKLLW